MKFVIFERTAGCLNSGSARLLGPFLFTFCGFLCLVLALSVPPLEFQKPIFFLGSRSSVEGELPSLPETQ